MKLRDPAETRRLVRRRESNRVNVLFDDYYSGLIASRYRRMSKHRRTVVITHHSKWKESKFIMPKGLVTPTDLRAVCNRKEQCKLHYNSDTIGVTYTNVNFKDHGMLVSYLTMLETSIDFKSRIK